MIFENNTFSLLRLQKDLVGAKTTDRIIIDYISMLLLQKNLVGPRAAD